MAFLTDNLWTWRPYCCWIVHGIKLDELAFCGALGWGAMARGSGKEEPFTDLDVLILSSGSEKARALAASGSVGFVEDSQIKAAACFLDDRAGLIGAEHDLWQIICAIQKPADTVGIVRHSETAFGRA